MVEDNPTLQGDFLKGLSQEEYYQDLLHCIDMFPVSSVHAP
jgi:hypothetical protein